MFYCKKFYVCALVGVLIKRLYEMYSGMTKIPAYCLKTHNIANYLCSVLLFNKPVLIPKFKYYCMIADGTGH